MESQPSFSELIHQLLRDSHPFCDLKQFRGRRRAQSLIIYSFIFGIKKRINLHSDHKLPLICLTSTTAARFKRSNVSDQLFRAKMWHQRSTCCLSDCKIQPYQTLDQRPQQVCYYVFSIRTKHFILGGCG